MNLNSKINIQMVDVRSQYLKIKDEIDSGIQEVIDSCAFINGPKVKAFQHSLEEYLGVNHVIPCANGTDALQIALMALDLQPGDEVIVPAFTYVATAEVIGLLQLKPIMVDVDPDTFNLTADIFAKAITPKTKAVVPVHLYGQSAEMEGIMKIAKEHNIYVVEDNAQAIGADYIFSTGEKKKTGTIGHIGCTSFYPSKNLGAYGDGGAIFTNDEVLGLKIKKIANHGQEKKYVHGLIGCNSRLDSIQAVILDVKLKHLDHYCEARRNVANAYDNAFANVAEIATPVRASFSTHVFHQYTLKIKNGKRDELQKYLQEKGVPSMIYYPIPLYNQKAFSRFVPDDMQLATTELLCEEVISLPIHTEMDKEQLNYITVHVKSFFKS
jgi:dTDP-4-amino-4,6-dideoxygalactose transaminase